MKKEFDILLVFMFDRIGRIDEILKQRVKIEEEKRQMAMRAKGEAMFSGNIFYVHFGGRITTTIKTHDLADRFVHSCGNIIRLSFTITQLIGFMITTVL